MRENGAQLKQDGFVGSFCDDLERVGLFDEHILPLTFLLRQLESRVPIKNLVTFDVRSLDLVFGNISAMLHPASPENQWRSQKHGMSRGSLPWTFRLEELEKLAETDPGVQRLLIRICGLLVNDLICLPYPAPVKCQDIVESASSSSARP